MRYNGLLLALISALLLMTTGCVKNDLEELENKEKKIISQYLTDHNISSDKKTESGIYFIETKAGTGIKPVLDNYVIINYVGRYMEDGVIRETSYDSLKSEWPMSDVYSNYLYGPVKMLCGYSMPGINEALEMMQEGSKATVILPSDKANYDYKPLVYELELLKVIKNPVHYEDSVLNLFVQENFGDTAQIDTSNVWYKVIQDSPSTETFGTGDSIYFNFSAHIIDGYGKTIQTNRIFDSNTGESVLKYKYGATNVSGAKGQILEGVKLPNGLKFAFDSAGFKNQTRVSVALGYDMAYGKTGFVSTTGNYIVVPVYQSVLYDIEVVKIIQGLK